MSYGGQDQGRLGGYGAGGMAQQQQQQQHQQQRGMGGMGGMGGGEVKADEPEGGGVFDRVKSKFKPTLILRCKVAIVGDAHVGKTALTQMFHSGGQTFQKQYAMTVGVDFCVKVVNIPETDAAVELYMFDTSGQSIFNQRELGAKNVRGGVGGGRRRGGGGRWGRGGAGLGRRVGEGGAGGVAFVICAREAGE